MPIGYLSLQNHMDFARLSVKLFWFNRWRSNIESVLVRMLFVGLPGRFADTLILCIFGYNFLAIRVSTKSYVWRVFRQ